MSYVGLCAHEYFTCTPAVAWPRSNGRALSHRRPCLEEKHSSTTRTAFLGFVIKDDVEGRTKCDWNGSCFKALEQYYTSFCPRKLLGGALDWQLSAVIHEDNKSCSQRLRLCFPTFNHPSDLIQHPVHRNNESTLFKVRKQLYKIERVVPIV